MTNALQPGTNSKTAIDLAEATERKIERDSSTFGSGLALVICGFPGAGKTTASFEAESTLLSEGFERGFVVDMDQFEQDHDVDGNDARTFIGAIDREKGLVDANYVVFDGVKSLEEIEYICKFFDSTGILYIESHHAARHNRLIERAKRKDHDLDQYSSDSLRALDTEVGNAGLSNIQDALYFDRKVTNNAISQNEFQQAVSEMTREIVVLHEIGQI